MGKKNVVDNTIKKLWEDCFKSILKQDWKKALSMLGQLQAMDPDNSQVHLKIGDILQRTGDRIGALASYHQAALCLINQGFKQKAIAIYKVILRIEPNDTEALNMSRNIIAEMEEEKTATPLPKLKGAAAPETATEESPAPFISAEDASLPDEPLPTPEARVSEEKDKKTKSSEEVKIPWIFSSLSEEEFEALNNIAAHRNFSDGEAVVNEGDRGDSMFTIKSGSARVTTHVQNRAVELATLSEGDFFGEVAFLTGRPRTASVIADGKLQVMDINRDVLQKVLEKHPRIMDRLVEFYYSRVKDTLLKVKSR
jgi:CRP-like cAMP-binding protein